MPDAALEVSVSYPGISPSEVMDCAYTCSWSVSPGRIALAITGRDQNGRPKDLTEIEGTGDLSLSDGLNPPVPFKDCQVVDLTAPNGDTGPLILTLYDGRWRWDFGSYDGRFNIPFDRSQTIPPLSKPLDPQGNAILPPQPAPKGEETILPRSKRTAPELAKMLLKAMKVKKYDLSGLDPRATPYVNWVAVNPAHALAQLAGDLGCVVAFNPSTLAVKIAKQGDGADLPGGELRAAPELKAKPRPDILQLRGARDRVQMRIVLLAAGVDLDGSVKPLQELSYAPEGPDWTKYVPGTLAGIPTADFLPGNYTQLDAAHLADETVYRYYVPLFYADPMMAQYINTSYGKIASSKNPVLEAIRKEIVGQQTSVKPASFGVSLVRPNDSGLNKNEPFYQFRLLPFCNWVVVDDTGREGTGPAICKGRHTPPDLCLIGSKPSITYGDTTAATQLRVPFQIHDIGNEDQAVVFAKKVFAFKDDGKYYPAEIVLECAVEFATGNGQWFRSGWEMKQGQRTAGRVNPTRERNALIASIVREDVRFQRIATWGAENKFKDLSDNEDVVRPRAEYYLRGESQQYELVASGDATYPGLQPIYPDGAIMQVSWSISPPTTRASRSTEHALYLPSFEDRRAAEQDTLEQQRREKTAIVETADRASAAVAVAIR